jgi:hypothetical protein
MQADLCNLAELKKYLILIYLFSAFIGRRVDPTREEWVDKHSQEYFRIMEQDYADEATDTYNAVEKGKKL